MKPTVAILYKRATGVYHSNRGNTMHAMQGIDCAQQPSLTELDHCTSNLFSMSLSTLSSPNMQSIREALDTYTEQMKIDLKDNPFADEVKGCNSPEAILRLLEKNRDEFKEYRDKNRKFIDCLNPVVKFVHTFSGILGEATSLVSAKRS